MSLDKVELGVIIQTVLDKSRAAQLPAQSYIETVCRAAMGFENIVEMVKASGCRCCKDPKTNELALCIRCRILRAAERFE